MRNLWKIVLGLWVIAMWLGASALAQAASSTGPYYATPSWDQKLACTTAANCPRFIVLTDWNSDAVLDRETGLVWEQSPGTTTRVWINGQLHCGNKNVGNRKGWRVPTLQELTSLIDPTVPSPGPALPAGHPFSNVQSDGYWSATTSSGASGSAWDVSFSSGSIDTSNKSFPNNFVWCVRGGQGVDPQ